MRSGRRALAHGVLLASAFTTLVAVDAAPEVPTYGAADGGPSLVLPFEGGRSRYNGVARYIGRAQCTGVFVATRPEGGRARDVPAYVLTNGHCSDFPGANDVLLDRAAPANHRVIFNYFADAPERQVSIPVARIVYATMKGQDLAVLELAVRHDEVVGQGIEPWPMAPATPSAGEPVVVVGAPLTGTVATSFMRLAACRLDGRADAVLEHIWHWLDFFRIGCSDIREGSSGSPVLSRRSGRLLGLVNTTTRGASRFTECALNHPCEPERGGRVVGRADVTYVTPLVRIDGCFDANGRFALGLPACPLDTGRQVRPTPSFLGSVNPRLEATPFGQPRRRWDVTVSGPFDYYSYKIVPAATGDCRELRGYTLPRRVAERPAIDDPLPETEGHRFLCILGVASARGATTWQSRNHPTVVVVRIDATPPQVPARVRISESDIAWVVAFETLEPEISAYTYKFGRPGDTRCSDPADYRPVLVPFVSLPKANRPYVFCTIPYDAALNPGSTFETILP